MKRFVPTVWGFTLSRLAAKPTGGEESNHV